MNLFVIKLLTFFIYPMTIALGAILIGIVLLILNKKRAALLIFSITVLFLWLCSTPIFCNYLHAKLERVHLPVKCEESKEADAIVILGGAVGAVGFPRLYPDLCNSSDRVYHAANLYKARKAPFIIASGGTIPWTGTIPETTPMVRLLNDWGVPPESILLESASINSYENGLYTKRLMEERGMKNVLLVTSALHMRRALATFRAAGVDAIPSPTDYGVVELGQRRTLIDFLPSAACLEGTTQVIREVVGYWVYKWWGWI